MQYPQLSIRVPLSEGGHDFIARVDAAARNAERDRSDWLFLQLKRAVVASEAANAVSVPAPVPVTAIANSGSKKIFAVHSRRGVSRELDGKRHGHHHASGTQRAAKVSAA